MKTKRPVPKNALKIFETIIDELHGLNTNDTKDLAEEAGVHYTTLWAWKAGEVRCPRFDTFVKVAEAVGYELVLTRKKATLRAAA